MTELPTVMAVLRGLHMAALLSLLGTAGFIVWMLPAATTVPDQLLRRLTRLGWLSGLIALLAGAAWFTIQSAMIADADNLSDVVAALPVVAAHTRYGNIMMLRLVLLVVATALAGRGLTPVGLARHNRAATGLPGLDSPGPGEPTIADAAASANAAVAAPAIAEVAAPAIAEVAAKATIASAPAVPRSSAQTTRPDRGGDGSYQSAYAPTKISVSMGAPPPANPARNTGQRKRRPVSVYLTLGVTAIALGLQGLIGHAGAAAGAIGDGLVLSECLHLLAAGIWLGALAPLALSLHALPPAQVAAVCERFSPFGLACVLVLAGTGFGQGLQLIGSLPALFGTEYGHFALLKITFFLFAVVLATLNRLWLTDRLAGGAAAAHRHLLASVGVETCLGLGIVTAAAFMASSPPAAHSTPVWPFSWQFSLVTVNEDPDLRQELLISLAAMSVAVALVAGSLLWRRFRLVALAVLALTIALRGPSLGLLTVEAFPTSFQTSPTDFAAASIARGQTLFTPNCASCHGPDGEGNGPAAAALRIKPADLTMPHLWEHTDGEMFWWLTHGIDDPEGGLAMPGFATSLSADDRWALIDYIRAHNAGLAMRRDAAFDVPVRAPGLPILCAGVAASTLADLAGHPVHAEADAAVRMDVAPQSGLSTINLALRDGATAAPGACVASEAAAWPAYAVLAGLPPDKLAGTEFLIDPNGWLRAVQRPGEAGGWHTPDELATAIRGMIAKPIEQSDGGHHEHHH